MCCLYRQRQQRYKQFTYIPNKIQSILLMKDRNILKQFISERFISVCDLIIHRYNIPSKAGFYEKIQIHGQVYSDIKNKKLYVGIEHISNLLVAFENVNVQWIFTGIGHMFLYDTNKQKRAIDDFNRAVRDDLAAENIPEYGNYDDYIEKYVKQLESENMRLIDECKSKQDIVDGFLNGSIVKQ